MKRLCSLLLLLFISAASVAETNDSLMTTFPSKNRVRFSLEVIDEDVVGSDWNRKTLTYRFSDQFGIGVVRNGILGNGAGFKYDLTDNITLLGIVFRSHYMDDKALLIGVKIVFKTLL